MTLTLFDEFCGFGGSSQGCAALPEVELTLAANHNPLAIDVHQMNFPDAEHHRGDVAKLDIEKFPRADLYWASPACPGWSDARGVKRDFDQSAQGVLFDEELGAVAPAHVVRSRALMEEVPRYLRAMARRTKPVLAGVVENVVQVAKWDQWGRWLREIRAEGYETRVIALNSMHAQSIRTRRAPQSRPRAYVAYWHRSLGRTPDWDRWLRPLAYCPICDEVVNAIQVFKRPGQTMGVYGIRNGQYVYRCPRVTCRNRIIEPFVVPAAAAIDWSLPPGRKIGERVDAHGNPNPLKPATVARIENGLLRYTGPFLAPAGGTWRDAATPLDVPMPTRTTRDSDGLVSPPLVVPCTGRHNTYARTVTGPLPTQTTRQENALVMPPVIAELRGGGSRHKVRAVDQPLSTFSAQGTHHGLVQAEGITGVRWNELLVPYYRTGRAHPVSEPMGTLTTHDRYSVVARPDTVEVPDVVDCHFRMLTPAEIAAGMAFDPDYKVKGSNRDQVRGFGNAVTPPCAEVLMSALVECITGEPIAA